MSVKKIALWVGISAGVTALIGAGYYLLSAAADELCVSDEAPAVDAPGEDTIDLPEAPEAVAE